MYEDAYWNQFGEISPYWYQAFLVLYILIGIFGIIGNGMVLWFCIRYGILNRTSNYFIMNLALSDSLFLVTNIPISTYNCLHQKWMFNEIICNFYGLCGALFGFVSISTMTFISIEKCVMIYKPLLALQYNGNFIKRKPMPLITTSSLFFKLKSKLLNFKVSLVCAWLYGIVWVVLPFFGPNYYVLEGLKTSCTFDYLNLSFISRMIIITMTIGGFVLPVGFIILSYAIIIRKLKTRNKYSYLGLVNEKSKQKHIDGNTATSANESADLIDKNSIQASKLDVILKSEIKTLRNAIFIILLFCIAWLPYTIIVLIAQFSANRHLYVNPYTTSLPAMFAKASSIFNPFIYAFINKKFRSKLLHLCPCLATLSSCFFHQHTNSKDNSLKIKCTFQDSILLVPVESRCEPSIIRLNRKTTVIRARESKM